MGAASNIKREEWDPKKSNFDFFVIKILIFAQLLIFEMEAIKINDFFLFRSILLNKRKLNTGVKKKWDKF